MVSELSSAIAVKALSTTLRTGFDIVRPIWSGRRRGSNLDRSNFSVGASLT